MNGARIAAAILAGGIGSRLGADVPKPLVEVGGHPMIAHVLERIPTAIAPIVIAANDPAFAVFGYPVMGDRFADRRGPLAGLDAAATWLRRNAPSVSHILTLPGDTPFLPRDVAGKLTATADRRPRFARFEGRLQPTVALWPLALLDGLADYLDVAGSLSPARFASDVSGIDAVDFPSSADAPSGDPFFNVNTLGELAEARRFMGA